MHVNTMMCRVNSIVAVLPSSKFVPLQSSESNLEQLGKKSITVEKLMWVRCHHYHKFNAMFTLW